MGRAAQTLKDAVDFKTGWFKSRPPRRGGPDDRVQSGEGKPAGFQCDIGALENPAPVEFSKENSIGWDALQKH